MGSYSGYLLLEDLLDTLPEYSTALYNESNQLFNPSVLIVEDNCRTLLGRRVQVDYSIVGYVDLATGNRLTPESIDNLLSQGIYYRSVRSAPFCTSEGGVCKKCFEATYPEIGAVKVGSTQRVYSEVVLGTHIGVSTTGVNEFRVYADGEEISRVEVFVADEFTSSYTYRIEDDGAWYVLFTDTIPEGSRVFIRMYKRTSAPFMSYLSHTYSGNLLGATPMGSGILPLRGGLIRERISKGRLRSLETELRSSVSNIPENFLEYLVNIRDPLEKELFIMALYGVFYDVGV